MNDASPSWVEIAKLWVDGAGFALAITTAGLGLWRAHLDRKEALRQRREALSQAKRDLRWRQTVEAQASINRLNQDVQAAHAMSMLDWNGLSYETRAGVRERITWADMRKALRIADLKFQRKEVFIRNCFDALFNNFQLIHQQIKNDLFKAEDVSYPIEYFARRIRHPKNWPAFEPFLTKYNYARAKELIEQNWDVSKPSGESDIEEGVEFGEESSG